jgi:hypothetical protein
MKGGIGLKDGGEVFGEFAGLVGVTGCPGAVGCSKRHGGVGSSFELFGYFPEGVVSGCRGMKALKEVLDAVIFKLPEEVFKVPGCCIKEPFVQGGAMLVPGTAKATLFS